MISGRPCFVEDERCRFRPDPEGRLRVVVRLTMRCDLACPHCLARESCIPELDTRQWLTLMRQFVDINVHKVLLTGGEPLMRSDLVSFVDTLVAGGAKVDLNSNLQQMTPELLRALGEAGLNEISVSIEGPEEVHDRMHGRLGAYARLNRAIHWAREMGIGVDASCCLTEMNRECIPALIEDIKRIPVRSITFARLLPIGHGRDSRKAISQDILDEIYAYVKSRISADLTKPVRATGLLGAPRPEDCCRGESLIGLSADGSLKACVLSDDNPAIHHPLDIGLPDALMQLRKELKTGRYKYCWQEGT